MNRLTWTYCSIFMLFAFATQRAEAQSELWDDIDYDGQPWVQNVSEPVDISRGLQNRHISLWASHGRYYDASKGSWQWQRPKLFCTTEDLYTQTVVVPYLMPMLENAGAIVFTPRERDWQRHEIIIDNDTPNNGTAYIEVNEKHQWSSTGRSGFAYHSGNYNDGENPFTAGTARQIQTVKKKKKDPSFVSYQPTLPEAGRYAVYVSYQTLAKSVEDAHYTVWHKGEKTDFVVNQQMGGGTWVYLGTFEFDEGSSEFNRVVITNQSDNKKGIVTTDAVRFGGGMGNIRRGGVTSGLPRALEGARYYAQWAGMPYDVYSLKGGSNDYDDDIYTRPMMTNYLAGGSCFVPNTEGLNVPIELSLAVHSDAGRNGNDLVGPLAIYTTEYNDGRFNSGAPRLMSKDFADGLLSNAVRDITAQYGRWKRRVLWDRNYGETRIPEVPSAIFEILSHENFPDMRMGQDPNFRFTLARSIYKTILRYVNSEHGQSCVVTPLAPDHFKVELKKGKAHLSWQPVEDKLEPSAKPTSYIVYTALGNADFDNGEEVSSTSFSVKLEPNILYSFKVAAANKGGKSFCTEVLSALYNPEAEKTVMVINGFHRLSSPAVRMNSEEAGFDLDEDPGITYGRTAGWIGRQTNFDRSRAGNYTANGLGWSSDEYFGRFIAGNDFNYVRTHATAIGSANRYNIASSSSDAVENGSVHLQAYALIDLVLGQERNDGHSLVAYKAFSPVMQSLLRSYTRQGGSLLVSGSYVATDMQQEHEQNWLADVLKCMSDSISTYRDSNDNITGMGTSFRYYHRLNEHHYASTASDALIPLEPAFATMTYADGRGAAIAYMGDDYRAITMGFPFECIQDRQKQRAIMQGLLNFLIK
ncbi:MAG: xanthan lyase [Prevotella sp.]|nr:xanthan lyase [Prevotella sp.]